MYPNDFRLRWYSPADLESVMTIESRLSVPWTVEHVIKGGPYIVMGRPGYTAGYIGFRAIQSSSSPGHINTVRIFRLAIDPAFRRRRIGSLLIEAAERQVIRTIIGTPCKGTKTGTINTEILVADSMDIVHYFLRAIGFKARVANSNRDVYLFNRISVWESSIMRTSLRPLVLASIGTVSPPANESSNNQIR